MIFVMKEIVSIGQNATISMFSEKYLPLIIVNYCFYINFVHNSD
jgi:hypothetical protein